MQELSEAQRQLAERDAAAQQAQRAKAAADAEAAEARAALAAAQEQAAAAESRLVVYEAEIDDYKKEVQEVGVLCARANALKCKQVVALRACFLAAAAADATALA